MTDRQCNRPLVGEVSLQLLSVGRGRNRVERDELGHVAGAVRDLGAHLQRWPESGDADVVRSRLLELLGDGRLAQRTH